MAKGGKKRKYRESEEEYEGRLRYFRLLSAGLLVAGAGFLAVGLLFTRGILTIAFGILGLAHGIYGLIAKPKRR